jgi:hypothetical protein
MSNLHIENMLLLCLFGVNDTTKRKICGRAPTSENCSISCHSVIFNKVGSRQRLRFRLTVNKPRFSAKRKASVSRLTQFSADEREALLGDYQLSPLSKFNTRAGMAAF